MALVTKGDYTVERASALCRIDVRAGYLVIEHYKKTGKTWLELSGNTTPSKTPLNSSKNDSLCQEESEASNSRDKKALAQLNDSESIQPEKSQISEEGEDEQRELLVDINKSPYDMDDKELQKKWWMEPFIQAGR